MLPPPDLAARMIPALMFQRILGLAVVLLALTQTCPAQNSPQFFPGDVGDLRARVVGKLSPGASRGQR